MESGNGALDSRCAGAGSQQNVCSRKTIKYMKIEPVKLVFALGIALIVGFLCEILAPEVGDRNWISFVVATVSMLSMLFPAIGVSYSNVRRGANVKVTAWIMAIV